LFRFSIDFSGKIFLLVFIYLITMLRNTFILGLNIFSLF